jgi:protocatechuate 3,4-dioxygenase beta subunit
MSAQAEEAHGVRSRQALLGAAVLGTVGLLLVLLVSRDDAPASASRPLTVATTGVGAFVEPPPAAVPAPLLATEAGEFATRAPPPQLAASSDNDAAESPMLQRNLAVVVVDADGKPVADAIVESFAGLARKPLAERFKIDSRPTPEQLEKLRESVNQYIDAGDPVDDPTWHEPLGRWRTDATGNATVSLPATAACLVATHDTMGSSGEVMVAEAAPGESATWKQLKLSPRGVLRGRVLDTSGHAVASAQVVFTGTQSFEEGQGRPRLPRPLETDGDGSFTIDVDTKFFCKAHAEFESRMSPDEYVHVWPGKTEDIELRFAGAFAVTGVVLDPQGAPVAKARVDVGGYEVQADPVVSDQDGRFRLELARECHVVLVAKVVGFVPDDVVAATLSQSQPVADVVLHVIEPATISGRVEWSDGMPIAGVMVSAKPAEPDPDALDPASLAAWMTGGDERDFKFELGSMARTDSDGRFTLRTVHPRFSHAVTCFGGRDLPGKSSVEPVPPGAADVRLVFNRIEAGADVLQGRVTDAETSAPIERYELTCSEWRYGHPQPFGGQHLAIDDATGRFEIAKLEPGKEYGLVVEASGYPAKPFGPLRPGGEQQPELALGRHASLRVVVTNTNGEAQPGASIQLMEGSESGFGAVFSTVSVRAAGPNGVLDWPDLKPKEYSVEAVSGRLRAPRQSTSLAPGRTTTIQLEVREPAGSGGLEIRTTRKDGSPWSGAEVKVVIHSDGSAAGSDPVYLGSAGPDGRLVFEGLDPGTYIVDVSGDGTIIPLQRVEVSGEGTTTITIAGGK